MNTQTIQTKEAIISLLNSVNDEDVALGIVLLVRENDISLVREVLSIDVNNEYHGKLWVYRFLVRRESRRRGYFKFANGMTFLNDSGGICYYETGPFRYLNDEVIYNERD